MSLETNVQSASFELSRRTLIRAGAGAGKTTELVSIFLAFAQQFITVNKSQPRIVITTFTRKATQELRERLLAQTLKQSNEDLFKLINSKNKTHISTIHGILSLFLSQYGADLSLSPDFKIISTEEEDFLIKKVMRLVFKSEDAFNFDKQVILDSFKTSQLVDFFKKFYALKYEWGEVDTFSEFEIESAIKESINEFLDEIKGVAEVILASSQDDGYIQLAKHLRNLTLSEDNLTQKCQQFMQVAIKPRYSSKKMQIEPDLEEQLKVILKKINEIAEDSWPAYDLDEQLRLNKIASQLICFLSVVFEKVKSEKINQSTVTMADLEFFALELINKSPQAVKAFSSSWDYWMIDEYQDTSPLQVRLLDAFIADRPYFMVGDPQQSIYSFRGARREVFESRKESILNQTKNTDLKYEFRMKQVNYRSQPEVITFLNTVFCKLGEQFQAMDIDPAKQVVRDQVPVRLALNFASDEKTDLNVIHEILFYLNTGLAAEDICVLGRTNKELDDIAQACKKIKIPYQLHVGGSFFSSREIVDLCFFIKFLKNSFDNENLISLFKIPHLRIDEKEIFNFVDLYRSNKSQYQSLWQGLMANHSEHAVITKLIFYRRLANQVGLSFTLKEFLLKEDFLLSSTGLDPSGRREAHIWKFFARLSEEEKKPGFNILKFIQKSHQDLNPETSSSAEVMTVIEPKRVNLMTIHASKGLQFKAVILANTHKGNHNRPYSLLVSEEDKKICFSIQSEKYAKGLLPPQSERIVQEIKRRDGEESLRFFYVALSRAQEYISLTADHLRKDLAAQSWYKLAGLPMTEGKYENEGFSYKVIFFSDDQLTEQLTKYTYDQKNEIALADLNPPRFLEPRVQTEKSMMAASVTDLLQSSKSTANEVWVQSAKKAVFGTHVHRLFELLKLNPDYVSEYLKSNPLLTEAFEYLQTLGTEFPILKLIDQGHAEWGFTVRMNGQRIQGQIDLWGIVDSRLYIIDYKTGSSDHVKKAFEQIKIYYNCICHIWPEYRNLQSTAVVIYPLEKVVKSQSL